MMGIRGLYVKLDEEVKLVSFDRLIDFIGSLSRLYAIAMVGSIASQVHYTFISPSANVSTSR